LANKKCVREKYLYLSAMLRAREAKMLTRDKAERMIDAPSFEEAAKMLTDCGYRDMSGFAAKQVEAALAEHRAEIFSELARLSPDAEPVEVFRMRYDYHNAKILIKTEAEGRDRTDLMSNAGRVNPEVLKRSFAEEKYLGLPPVLADAMIEAKSALARTQNPQLADFILDRAYFSEIAVASDKLGSTFLRGYARMLIDAANLRSAVRTMRMNKDVEFLKTALISGGGVDIGRITAAFGSGDTLAAIYANSLLANAAALGAAAVKGGAMTEFELACDNAVTAYLTGARLVSYGEAPVIAYLAAVEGEVTALRMILTGKLAGLPAQTIRERLRDFYA
jgi:V/A-type H+/Na+-transporting ATPase subunit C